MHFHPIWLLIFAVSGIGTLMVWNINDLLMAQYPSSPDIVDWWKAAWWRLNVPAIAAGLTCVTLMTFLHAFINFSVVVFWIAFFVGAGTIWTLGISIGVHYYVIGEVKTGKVFGERKGRALSKVTI